jgi:RNA-directed DNA polymerase
MTTWQSQLFKENAPPDSPIDAAIAAATALRLVSPQLPPVFTLGHLAYSAEVPYKFIRSVAERSNVAEHYNVFRIRKRAVTKTEQFRWIAAPHPLLLKTQRWINCNILRHLPVHDAAYAYMKESSAFKAARLHCKATWLIKVDISNFFESILETKIYQVFRRAGYQPLISFELSRICTRLANPELHSATSGNGYSRLRDKGANHTISAYASFSLGHLPQGAPTSPMLANLVAKSFDEKIMALAGRYGLRYSRYSDDIVLSTRSKNFDKKRAQKVVGELYRILRRAGFTPNLEKTKVSGPGSKMIVLGLLVDGDVPRLTSEFKEKLRMHLYFCRTRGPVAHALDRKFESVIGLKHHLLGLISYAGMVDTTFADHCRAQLNSCSWPILGGVDFNEIPAFA